MLVKTLEKEMAEYAKTQEFEKAQDVKRILFALSHIQDVSLIKNSFHNAQVPGDTAEKNTQVRIEAYDIAHLSGTSMTGAFVVVEDGMPNKAEYRKFKIRTVKKSNDPAALAEVLKRRFKHLEWPLPQILVVDGNDVQKNVAENIVKELNISGITVVAVVKNEKHKARAIIGDTEVTQMYQKDIVLANEEAHRFVLAYHKKLRSDFLRP
jgi:excinuclease ABC subunit C